MKKIISGLLGVALFVLPSAANAQTAKATTAAPSYVNGSTSPLSQDLSGNLRTNCVSGCAGGSFNNSGSAVAPSAANGQAAAWLYAFDASNWQYVGIDASHNLTVKVNAALPAGSAIIGKVGIDQTTPGTTNGVQVNAALPAGANTIGAVTQASGPWTVNQTQINGVTVLAGNGATGTGSQRNTIASDNSAVALWGQGATGAAVPANATLAGNRSGANMVAAIQADASVPINVSTATDTQLVALSGTTKIYVTSYDVIAGGTGNITFEYGTGSNCATGKTALTGAYPLTAQAGIAKGNGQGPVLVVPAGNALCVLTSAGVQMSGSVSYTQF